MAAKIGNGGYSVKIEGLDDFVKDLGRAADKFNPFIEQALRISVEAVQSKAQSKLYLGHGLITGALRRSIYTVVEKKPLGGTVGVGEKYGVFVEFGTRPHIIRPKTARVLRFKVNGQYVYARQVRHPGTKGLFFMKTGLEDSIPTIDRAFNDGMKIFTAIMAGKA